MLSVRPDYSEGKRVCIKGDVGYCLCMEYGQSGKKFIQVVQPFSALGKAADDEARQGWISEAPHTVEARFELGNLDLQPQPMSKDV